MENKQKNTKNILWTLFKTTFILSACTFGGGFVIVSLMKKKFSDDLKWIEESEMLDITAIAQSSPGPIPINASVILGYRMCGILGSLVAIVGTSLPPIIIITIISIFYTQFRENEVIAIALQVMRAGVAAVIADVVFKLAKNIFNTKSYFYIALMFITFILTYFFDVSALIIILMCLVIGIVHLLLTLKGDKKNDE